jgi:hypothetical protein
VANILKHVRLQNLYLTIVIAFLLLKCFARVFVCMSSIHKLGNETTNIYLISKQTLTILLTCVTYTDMRPIFVQTCRSHDAGRIHK